MPVVGSERVGSERTGTGRRDRGALEHEVLAVLAGAPTALTPGAVRTGMAVPLAYTTVMTALTRLLAKGAVTRERSGRAFAYRLADPAAAAARQMVGVLDRGDDRAGILAHFLEELDPGDVPVLQRLLRETEPEPGLGHD